MTDNIQRLSNLFLGFERAHGRYAVTKVTDKGKNEGRAGTIKEPVTDELWQGHVNGVGAGLGIIPLRSDNSVVWGVIDIDQIGIDHAALEKKCHDNGMPLVICRSKSGGAHCFLFLSAPLPAARVVPLLESFAARLGHAGCEVFPKQVARSASEEDIGNWLNMPYFHAEKTNRYCIHNGADLDLPQFLDYAEDMRQTDDQLATADVLPQQNDGGLFADGPPCLQTLHARGGFPAGTRNDGMYNVAVYLKKRFPDNWEEKMSEYNAAMCREQAGGMLDSKDVKDTIKSARKKEYWYRCKKAPINAVCMSRVCAMREHGVGDNTPILGLTKYNTDPLIWAFDVRDTRVEMTSKELNDQRLFRLKMIESGISPPPLIPQNIFNEKIRLAIDNCKTHPVPYDATPKGQFKEVFHQFLDQKAKAVLLEDLLNANTLNVFLGEDKAYRFKLRALQKYLDREAFEYPKNKLTFWLTELGATSPEYPESVKVARTGEWKSLRAWRYTRDEDGAELPAPKVERTEDF